MRGHAELYYADWALLAIGIYLFFNGDTNGVLVFAVGAVLHFASGGTMPF